MRDVNVLIHDWCKTTLAAHPELEAHIDELADHIACVAAKYTASGFNADDAFMRALDELGEVDELATQFRTAAHQSRAARTFRCLIRTRRGELAVSVAWIILSLAWAGAMIGFEDNLSWMLAGWTLTTFLPLSVIGARLARAEEESGSIADR